MSATRRELASWGGGGRGKQWTGSVHQSADGLAWHNHYRLDCTLATVRWEAEAVSRLLGTRAAALLCVHGAYVQRGGVDAGGVAMVPAVRLCAAPGHGRCRTATSNCWPSPPHAAAAGRLTLSRVGGGRTRPAVIWRVDGLRSTPSWGQVA
jgi:hypothetical protein